MEKKTKSGAVAAPGRVEITVGGTKYPCYYTFGAGLEFKNATGRDPETAQGSVDNSILIWCCVKSACRREGIEFKMTLEEFCDNILPSDMEAGIGSLSGSGEKKA